MKAKAHMQLTQEEQSLGYTFLSPPKSMPVKDPPVWQSSSSDVVDSVIQEIVDDAWPVALLRKQIRQLGIKPKGRARVDLARQMVETLMNPQRLRRAVNSLSQEAQEFYVYVILHLNLKNFYASEEITVLRPFSTPPVLLQSELSEAGLALDTEGEFIVPGRLMRFLPPLSLTLPKTEADVKSETHDIHLAKPQMLVGKIQRLLSLVQEREYALNPILRWNPEGSRYYYLRDLVPTPEGARELLGAPNQQLQIILRAPTPRLTEAALDEWSRVLALPPSGAEFLYHLLRRIGVFREGTPVVVEPKLMQRFLTLAAGEQIAVLFRYFTSLSDWAIFWPAWRAGHVQAQWLYRPSYWGSFSYELILAQTISALRQSTLNVLATLPHDTWLSVSEVSRVLFSFFPDELNFRVIANLLSFTLGEGGWESMLYRYLETLLQGPLRWLGLVDVAWQTEKLVAFRLHHVQDLLWERSEAFPISEVHFDQRKAVSFDVEAGRLRLRPPVPVELLQHIEMWAEPAGIDGPVMCYQQDLDRLYQAFEDGQTPKTLTQAWRTSAGFEPPEELAAWWAHWGAHYGKVRLYPHQALLQVRDEFAIQELQVAIPDMRESFLGLLAPRVALLNQENVEQLIDKMQAKGYMPKEAT